MLKYKPLMVIGNETGIAWYNAGRPEKEEIPDDHRNYGVLLQASTNSQTDVDWLPFILQSKGYTAVPLTLKDGQRMRHKKADGHYEFTYIIKDKGGHYTMQTVAELTVLLEQAAQLSQEQEIVRSKFE